jgi:lysophospholipase L1-like esterase
MQTMTFARNPRKPFRLLALGDSYTIGESVPGTARWPEQWALRSRARGIRIQRPVEIIAQTGWTTDELLAAISAQSALVGYDFVTLQIGVNNQYRGWPLAPFEAEFEQLLCIASAAVAGNRQRVQVLSIPDWGQTPFGVGCGRDLAQVSAEINAFNAASQGLCERHQIAWLDITEVTRKHSANPKMHAEDGLHPSAAMYRLWAEALLCTGKFGKLGT